MLQSDVTRPHGRGSSAQVVACDDGTVVKLFHPGFPSGAVQAEWNNARAAHERGLPSPRPIERLESGGRTGIRFERCEGPTLHAVLLAGTISVKNLARLFVDLQCAIHSVSGIGFPDQSARLRARIGASKDAPMQARRAALASLEAHDVPTALCHGDFHPFNVVITDAGPRVVDWLDACAGEPAADIVRTRMLIEHAARTDADAEARGAFLAEYRTLCAALPSAAVTERWVLPVAIARLGEPVDANERQALLSIVRAAAKVEDDA